MEVMKTRPVRRGQPARAFFRPSDGLKDLQALVLAFDQMCAALNKSKTGRRDGTDQGRFRASLFAKHDPDRPRQPLSEGVTRYWGVW